MEILVIIMLALFLMIIAFAVIMYVLVRNNSVTRAFNRGMDHDLDDFDDDDDDEVPNIVLPISFRSNYSSMEEKETEAKEESVEEPIERSLMEKDDKNEKMEEVVNILINKKNYIFLANGNQVSKNEHLKLVIDNKIYFGTVTKANYQRDVNVMKVRPKKLIIVKNKAKKEENKNIDINEEVEFIPRRKNKN